MSAGALHGLRVIDLTQMLAGPFCTQLIADQGADVIKIEPPQGDITRRLGPFRADDQLKAFGGYFQSINRNKRSVMLDLKTPAGRDALIALVKNADVVVENFRAGVMDKLGLSYASLRESNPRLVYTAIRGFGDPSNGDNAYIDWPAFDVVAQAMGGVMAITGPDAQTPMKVGPGIGDLVPAMLAAFGTLAAVLHARQSGQGQFVDVAMVDSMLAIAERSVYQYSYSGKVPRPEGNGHPLLCPFGMFPASDGSVTIGCPDESFWQVLCHAMGRPEIAKMPEYANNIERVKRRDEVNRMIAEYTQKHTKAELSAALGGKLPFGPVLDMADISANPYFQQRQMLVNVEQPGSAQPVVIAGVPVRLSATPGGIRMRAPLLGEHTAEILSSINHS
jgi:crotonobetainyl-CoA:carnitine CoA-transferase CaiB-like acyl-CoA transferase